jgi:dephospho-CoA kinase
MPKTLTIGLTGGIGSGKSAVSDAFGKLGVTVIDTDQISHDLTSKGAAAIKEIGQTFGLDVIHGGVLDRAKLRDIVFKDDSARKLLEKILHPKIREEVEGDLAKATSAYTIVVIPLLIEKKGYEFLDRILVVDCDEKLQLDRVQTRSGLSESQVTDIMSKQATRKQRLSAADDVITNNTDLDLLKSQVEALHIKYLDSSIGLCEKNDSKT